MPAARRPSQSPPTGRPSARRGRHRTSRVGRLCSPWALGGQCPSCNRRGYHPQTAPPLPPGSRTRGSPLGGPPDPQTVPQKRGLSPAGHGCGGGWKRPPPESRRAAAPLQEATRRPPSPPAPQTATLWLAACPTATCPGHTPHTRRAAPAPPPRPLRRRDQTTSRAPRRTASAPPRCIRRPHTRRTHPPRHKPNTLTAAG